MPDAKVPREHSYDFLNGPEYCPEALTKAHEHDWKVMHGQVHNDKQVLTHFCRWCGKLGVSVIELPDRPSTYL